MEYFSGCFSANIFVLEQPTLIWKQADFQSCCSLAALDGNWLIADQTIFTQVRKDSISWWALSSQLEDGGCFWLSCHSAASSALFSYLFSCYCPTRQLLLILGYSQMLYMNHFLGISFCKISHLSG